MCVIGRTISSKTYYATNTRTSRKCYFAQQSYFADVIKGMDFDMGRVSGIIQVDLIQSHESLHGEPFRWKHESDKIIYSVVLHLPMLLLASSNIYLFLSFSCNIFSPNCASFYNLLILIVLKCYNYIPCCYSVTLCWVLSVLIQFENTHLTFLRNFLNYFVQ